MSDLGFPLYLFFISVASPFGVPLEETFSIILAGLFSNTFADYAFFVTLIFVGLVLGDIGAYTVASYFETGFIKKLRKYEWYKKTYEVGESFFNNPSLTLKQNKCPQHVYVDLHETNKTEDK